MPRPPWSNIADARAPAVHYNSIFARVNSTALRRTYSLTRLQSTRNDPRVEREYEKEAGRRMIAINIKMDDVTVILAR